MSELEALRQLIEKYQYTDPEGLKRVKEKATHILKNADQLKKKILGRSK